MGVRLRLREWFTDEAIEKTINYLVTLKIVNPLGFHICYMYFVEGLSPAEISGLIKIDKRAVAGYINRAGVYLRHNNAVVRRLIEVICNYVDGMRMFEEESSAGGRVIKYRCLICGATKTFLEGDRYARRSWATSHARKHREFIRRYVDEVVAAVLGGDGNA